MTIPEMQRFKEKFPVYKDIDDSTLLTKIVQKFPVYKDIAEREFGVVKETPPTISSRIEGLSRIVKDRAGKAITLGEEDPEGFTLAQRTVSQFTGVPKEEFDVSGTPVERIKGIAKTAAAVTGQVVEIGFSKPVGLLTGSTPPEDPVQLTQWMLEPIESPWNFETPEPRQVVALKNAISIGIGVGILKNMISSVIDDPLIRSSLHSVSSFILKGPSPKTLSQVRLEKLLPKLKAKPMQAFGRWLKNQLGISRVQRGAELKRIQQAKKFQSRKAELKSGRTTEAAVAKKIEEEVFKSVRARTEFVRPKVAEIVNKRLTSEVQKAQDLIKKGKSIPEDLSVRVKGLRDTLKSIQKPVATRTEVTQQNVRSLKEVGLKPTVKPKTRADFFTKTKSKKKLLAESETYKKFILGKINVSRNLRDLIIGVTGDRVAGFDYKVKDLDTGEVRTHSTFISPGKVVEVSLEEVRSKVEPSLKAKKPPKEKQQIPPRKVEAISSVTPPKVDLKNEKIDEVPPVNVQKTEAPVQPTKEVTSNEGTEIIQIDIRTAKGIQRTYMNPSDVVRLEAEIVRSKITKVPALFQGIPVDSIIEKIRMKIGDESGYIKIPGVEQAARVVEQIKNVGDTIGAIVDPVRNAPAGVARAIAGAATAKNVLKFNIIRAQDLLNQMINGSQEQAEIITKFIESGGIEPFASLMSGEMRVVAEIVNGAINNMGKLAKKHKVIKTVLENYLPHLVKDPNLTPAEVDAAIRQAISTKRISKYVASKLPRVRTEEGEIIFPTIEALELAGYEVINKNAVDLYTFVMLSEGVAVINAELVEELMKIPYTPSPTTTKLLGKFGDKVPLPRGFTPMSRPLMQVMTLKEGESPPLGYKPMSRGVFAGKWASPEARPALSAISDVSLLSSSDGGRAVLKFINVTKRIRFLLPFFHTWNLYRNAIQARGLVQGTLTIFRGAKALKDPERVAEVVKMGVELHKLNKLAGGVVDKAYGEVGKFDIFGKMSEMLFLGLGDSISMGLAEYYKEVLKDNPKFNDVELAELVADTVNSLSGNIPEHEMNRFTRDVGRIALLARNWTLSNLRQATGALGVNPKHWSKEQRSWATKNWAASIARMFMYLYAINQILNYNASKKAYGTGRFTWENPKGRKILPLIAVDKITGKEYYASNVYGTVGDIIHWGTRFPQTLANKLNPSLRAIAQQLYNRDFFTGDKLYMESDNFMTQMMKRVSSFVDDHLPVGTQPSKSKVPLPRKLQLIRLLGVAVGSENQNADVLQKLFDFREQKNYKMDLLDKKIMRKMAKGDTAGAIEIGIESQRYSSVEGYEGLVLKMRNMTTHVYKSMSQKDKVDFLKSLKPKEKAEFFEALREGDVREKILQ